MPKRSMDSGIESTRDQILSVALELFSAQGFDGTGLQQIADRLGVTKAALYYHFKTKDELLAAIIEPLFADVEAVLDSAHFGPGHRLQSRRQSLEEFIDCLLVHRRVLGLLSRDIAILGRADIGPRGQAIQDRLSAAIVGNDLSLENRIKISFAISGLQGAIVTNSAATDEQLRGPVLNSINAILRSVGRDISAKAHASA
jgi:AcrR family transcriptional regulator